MTKFLLKNATIITDAGSSKIVDIAIENDKIVQIGTIAADWQADIIRDCNNQLAVAGFVNAHTHAAMTLLRSYADDMKLMDWLENRIWPIEAKMKPDDIYWGSKLAIAEMIKTGTTTFADMYGDMDKVGDAVAQTGIRAVLARGIIGVAPNGQQALQENIGLFKDYNNAADGKITVMFGPHAPYTCPPAFLRQVITEAQKLNAEIHIHLAESLDEIENCQKDYGKSPIELMEEVGLFDCGVLAAHCVHLSAADLAIMKKFKVRVAHNPTSNMKLASGIAPVVKMLEQGIIVGLGTDGSSSNNNLDMLEEIKMTTLLHKIHNMDPLVIPAIQGIKMATEYGAAAVGLGKSVGKLQVGYKADITLLAMQDTKWYPRHDIASLLVYSANANSVHTVIVNGKILLDNGRLTTIDEEQVIYETNKRAMNLLK